jgi:rod shape-determining protein MreD
LFIVFAIQESVIARIHLPITGFSFYLAVLVSLLALEDRNGAVIIGFIGGLILDLAPTSQSPFGQWALIFTLIGYLISSNLESVGDFTSQPFTFVFFVASGSALALTVYLVTGAMLGEENGTLWRSAIVVIGNFIWTMLFTPLFMPIITKTKEFVLNAGDRV